MRNVLTIWLAGITLLLGAISASALEGQFNHPSYKTQERLDFCFTFGGSCGQPVADMYCRIQGYERANGFEEVRASPTRIIANGDACFGGHCTTFRHIVCSTSAAERGPGTDWPTIFDY
jgi:hypothetical protein